MRRYRKKSTGKKIFKGILITILVLLAAYGVFCIAKALPITLPKLK